MTTGISKKKLGFYKQTIAHLDMKELGKVYAGASRSVVEPGNDEDPVLTEDTLLSNSPTIDPEPVGTTSYTCVNC